MNQRTRTVAAARPRSRSVPDNHYVFAFTELARVQRVAPTWAAVRNLLGGKGANLAEMTRLGMPVPQGFLVTTTACKEFLANGGDFPPGMWEQVLAALAQLEHQTGRHLGDPSRPLLVSVRSGAPVSMPGMMDTVLDLGIDDRVAAGMLRTTGNARFVFDCYRRLVQMYGGVVLGVPHTTFEALLADARRRHSVATDADLPADELERLVHAFKAAIAAASPTPFPDHPLDQLRGAIRAVFTSWNGKRAVDYRNATGIPHDLGTAVNIVRMVYGNLDAQSATGVVTTRNVTTGEPGLEGDFLVGAQGEDVVSGTRATRPIHELAEVLPRQFAQLQRFARRLERHYRDVQDIEFTIEHGTLWLLQTRNAKRTAQAAIRIAVDQVGQRLITRAEALRRIAPEQVDYFLHPQLEVPARLAARARGDLLAVGLNVSPGAAIGRIAFTADAAEQRAKQGPDPVLLLRRETRPDDVHGMLAATGTVTSHGGRTSHAALVARQFGKPAVVGATTLDIDEDGAKVTTPAGVVLRDGDWMSIDGTSGEVFAGQLPTIVPDLDDPYLTQLLAWADRVRKLEVWANADYPRDAERARRFGAEGLGLCRTEHMFFESERLPIVQAMILAPDAAARTEHLARLLPMQRQDFLGLFRAMDGLPVTIRLLDPPLHEFLPDHDHLAAHVTELQTRLRLHDGDRAALERELGQQQKMLAAVEALREQNPMLGRRGVRLGIHMPDLVRMQVRAILEAACEAQAAGIAVQPKIMIPLTTHSNELRVEREVLDDEARTVLREQGRSIRYQFGTMIEVPRAALVADRIAEFAEFFSFGTNDLTQTTYGISRDDAETGFLTEYLQKGLLDDNPFATIDRDGVGQLMRWCLDRGRSRRPDLQVGICGEHGGDPRTIAFCHELGLDYVSCSPFRVPVARLAAAHAALAELAAAGAP